MIPITGHTQLTALLGSPVAHSISPLMHNEAFHLLDLDYTYLCFDVNEENLKAAVTGLKTCGIRGFNLTMPNKNKIVELLDELSPAARLIGAVNTVVNDNGRLTGYNTDGVGYMQAVRDARYDVIGKTITIMGAGGAATAICAQAGSIIEDTSLYHPDLIVSDVIYNPRETRFLREAREAGCRTFNGMYMLLYQGAEAFRLWTGKEMPVEEIKAKYFSE